MNPIVFALDVPSINEAEGLCSLLEDSVGAFKVGLELFIATGKLPKTSKPIVLDLKLHDIPKTVARAITAGGELGAKYMTLHIQQYKTLEMAVKAAEPYNMMLFGVTVLTSMEAEDFIDLDYRLSSEQIIKKGIVKYRTHRLARFAYNCGIRGFVCSPQEVGELKQQFLDARFLVPGIRPAGSAINDQKRVGTPVQAIKDGADFIVVGRPIRDAANPVEAAQAIFDEVLQAKKL